MRIPSDTSMCFITPSAFAEHLFLVCQHLVEKGSIIIVTQCRNNLYIFQSIFKDGAQSQRKAQVEWKAKEWTELRKEISRGCGGDALITRTQKVTWQLSLIGVKVSTANDRLYILHACILRLRFGWCGSYRFADARNGGR
jgi:hypothetical protein